MIILLHFGVFKEGFEVCRSRGRLHQLVEPYVFGGVDLCNKFAVGILLDVSLIDDGSGGFEHSFQQCHLADVLQPLQHGGVNRIFGGVNAVQQCPAERYFIFRGLQQVDNGLVRLVPYLRKRNLFPFADAGEVTLGGFLVAAEVEGGCLFALSVPQVVEDVHQ